MIPNDFVQTLLSRVDIVEVVDRFVPLKKAGANYVACCPFHSEKTPSFSVSPTKQFYHCFGCGAHGTAIGFLMEHAGKSFPEAVEDLARDAGLTVPRVERPGEKERREEAADLNELLLTAARFYRARLKEAPAAIQYLKGRGLTGEIAARYGLGYAPDGWQNLAAVFSDYATGPLKDTGLVIDSDPGEDHPERKSRRYDRFRNRVMFPILDARGNVIGFGGRVIGAGEPKYLNSPETPLFEKGRELYGLYQARRAIREANRVIVVEGYMDVVALAQHGVENAVATLGTATTPFHVGKLLKLADDVVFCFDGDAAGRKAAWRALEVALPVLADGKVVSFLFLPPEDDPDTFVRREGREAFLAAAAQAKPLSQFLFGELAARVDMASDEGRARFLAEAKPLLAQVEAPALAAMLRHRLAEMARLDAAEIEALVPARAAAPRTASRPQPRTSRAAPSAPETRLLARLLLRPELAAQIPDEVLEGARPAAAVLKEVVAFCRANPHVTLGQVSAHFEGTELAGPIDEALGEPLLVQAEELDLEAEVAHWIGELAREKLARRQEELVRLMGSAPTPEQESEYKVLSARLEAARAGNPPTGARSKV